jgi:hypothetical protein
MQELQVKFTPANIVANIDELKSQLAERLEPYKGLVLPAEKIPEGKKIIAELNKEKRVIDDERKKVMREHKAAADPFDAGMKELAGMYDDATADMKAQVQASEAARKSEVREKLSAFLLRLWDEDSVSEEYRRAEIDDLVSLTAITTKGNPTAKVSAETRARVAADRALQDRTEMRLLRLENESYRAGLHAPLTRNHVNRFLFEDDDTYTSELNSVIAAEIERQKATEQRIAERNATQQQLDNHLRAQQEAEQPAASSAQTNQHEPVSEPQQHSPTQSDQATQSTAPFIVTCTFEPDVTGNVSEADLEAGIRKRLKEAGIKSLTSVTVTRNTTKNAA